jgi:hypothetical protein
MTAPVTLRDPAVIAAEISAVTIAAEAGSAFHEGARDALRWLLRGGPGPLGGQITGLPISLRAVVAELSAAEALAYGPPSGGCEYALGLEHALLWAEMATPSRPAQTNQHAIHGRSTP